MINTCANCEYHNCKCECMTTQRTCGGFCLKYMKHNKCYQKACVNCEIDNYFILEEE